MARMGGYAMEEARLEMRYQRGDASADEIQAVASDLLKELGDPDSDAAMAAREVGLDPAHMVGTTVEVKEAKQGLEPFLTAVLIGVTAHESSKAVEAFWQAVLWPRIKKLLGTRALGEKESARLLEDKES
jgi:hypothetical protein